MNLVKEAKKQIDEMLRAASKAAAEAGELPDVPLNGTVEIPKDAANGDFAANHAMASAKVMKSAPRKIAECLVSHLDTQESWIESVEIAGPGFMNFRLAETWYEDVLQTIDEEGLDYGKSDIGHGKKLMVEFVSANPTGPMHMGNARGGVLGDALASVMEKTGYDVWREFYVNDAGNQIEKFAMSIQARYIQLIKGEDAIEFPEDGYQGSDIKDLAEAFREKYGDGYIEKSDREARDAMAQFGLSVNIPKMKTDLEKYGIRYDEWFLESSLHESGFVEETVQKADRTRIHI